MVTIAAHPAKINGASAKLFPVFVATGAITLVAGYVTSQLHSYRSIMDGRFAQYNSAQSEESRRKTFEGTNLDPRRSMFNILGH